MSIRTGIGREELQELRHVAEVTGVTFESLTRATTRLGQTLVDNQGKTGETSDLIARLNLEIRDAQGEIRDMNDLFDETVEALSRMDNEVERNTAALRLFGRQGQELIPILDAGQGEVERLRREARDLGFVLSDVAIRDLSDFSTEMGMVQRRTQTAWQELMLVFLPALRVVLEWVNKAIDWFGDLSDEQKENILQWTALTVGVLGLVTTFGLFAKMGAVVLKWITILGGAISFLTAPWVVGLALLAGAVWLVWMAWDQNWLGIGTVIDKFVELVSAGLSALYNLLLQTELGQEIDRIFQEIKAVWDAEDLKLPEKIVEIARIVLDAIDWKWLLAGAVIAAIIGGVLFSILPKIPIALITLAFGALQAITIAGLTAVKAVTLFLLSKAWVLGLAAVKFTFTKISSLLIGGVGVVKAITAKIVALLGGAGAGAAAGAAGVIALGALALSAILFFNNPEEVRQGIYDDIRAIVEDDEITFTIKVKKITLRLLEGVWSGLKTQMQDIWDWLTQPQDILDMGPFMPQMPIPDHIQEALDASGALEKRPIQRTIEWFKDLFSASEEAAQEMDDIVQVIGDVSGEFGWLGDRLGAANVDLTDFMLTLGIMESNMENVESAVSSAAGEFQLLASTRANIEAMMGAVDWTDPIERTRAAFGWLESGVKNEFSAIQRHAKALEISLFDALQLWWVVGGPRLGEMGALGPAGLQLEATLGKTAEEIIGRVPGARSRAGQLGLQRGGILSGFGGADSIPALLAPGEAVIPGKIWRQGIGAIAAWFKSAGVAGFQEGGIAGNGGLLGLLLPGLSASLEDQGGVISALGSFIGDLPQTMADGLMGGLDGLIDIVDVIAETIFGAEEAERVTSSLREMQAGVENLMVALGFLDREIQETAEDLAAANDKIQDSRTW